jgi:hypothetical protein
MRKVLGFDVSANRVAWALCDSARFYGSGLVKKGRFAARDLVDTAVDMIKNMTQPYESACLEINLHPKVMHKGRLSPKMVRAYMRSRWMEGALIDRLGYDEPSEIIRKGSIIAGGFVVVDPDAGMYSLQATGGKDAKAKRRSRMMMLYAAWEVSRLSEDEIDALAIAHDCAVAIRLRSLGA